MCGIIGLFGREQVNQSIYDGLLSLQHRGQDAAGIVTCDDRQLNLRKDNGLVRDVFHTRHMTKLQGTMGIGHLRYPTAGSASSAEAQPFYVNSPFGIALAHNGNLNNAEDLKQELFNTDRRHINTSSDSEILLNIFARELYRTKTKTPGPADIFSAVHGVHTRCKGAYAAVGLVVGYGLFAFRDPHGIRPLVFGSRKTANGREYMVASESVALDAQGFDLERDVAPGEAVYVDMNGQLHTYQCAKNSKLTPCIFEHVYFARPDSKIDDIFVHKARMRMGVKLAQKLERDWPDHDIDVVIPVPSTSRSSAQEMANHLNILYREGFIKNRYIGRTFIMPGQQQRKKSVRQKLNPIELEFKDKNVLLVDDSIVRGTTSRNIVQMARESGAKKVYFASAAPAIRYPNVYGIDMPTCSELIAHGKTEEEICRAIGADRLIYQSLDDLIASVSQGNRAIEDFECSVFTGKYLTDISDQYLDELEARRNDANKAEERQQSLSIDLHNSA